MKTVNINEGIYNTIQELAEKKQTPISKELKTMILNQKIRSIRIDDELYNAVQELAKKDKTTFSKLVKKYLRKITGVEQ